MMSSRPFPQVSVAALTLTSLLASACTGPPASAPVTPADLEGRTLRGVASWYGGKFHGRQTANGETYDMHAMTAAHKTLPFDTWVEVLNLDNGRRATVRINDRGPFVKGRIIDLSLAAAEKLRMVGPGTAHVELQVLPAPATPALASFPGGDDGPFTVQVAAFEEEERAEAFRRRLARDLPEVEIRRQGGLFKVQVGRFEHRREAEGLEAAIEALGLSAFVVRPP